MSIIDRLTPVYYRPTRIGVTLEDGEIVARGDFAIYNADAEALATDHPVATLTPEQRALFLAWFNAQTDAYETATGLEPLP